MNESETRIVAADPTRTTQAPSDVLRLLVGMVALVIVVFVNLLFAGTVVEVAADLLRGLDRLPWWLVTTIVTVAELAMLLIVALVVGAAVRRRSWRLAAATAAAALLAAGLAAVFISVTDHQSTAKVTVTGVEQVFAVSGNTSWSPWALAALAGAVATVGPWQARRWRRIGWAVVICSAAVHFVVTPVALSTLMALLVGWTTGTAVTVITGSPSHRPTGAAIATGLRAVGVRLTALEQASLDARGSTPYFAEMPDGRKLFVKALGEDERSADLLFRMYRRIQPRDLGDEKPFSTLRRAVEHEALVSLTARDLGIRTPRLVAFARAEPAGFTLAYEAIAGRSLDRLDPTEVTDEVLDQVWALVADLRSHGIAHRDLRLANVFVADDGEAWIIDFGFSELAASVTLLATDIAELIASSSSMVGPDRAVAAAVRGVGPEAARSALARLKLPMLSGATRTALKEDPSRLEAIRAQLEATAD